MLLSDINRLFLFCSIKAVTPSTHLPATPISSPAQAKAA